MHKAERPGNEGPFYKTHGVHLQVKPMPDSAPLITNRIIEALCHHDQRQAEARECQVYTQQQDNTSLPITDFSSPVHTDKEVITIPDSPEGTAATAAAPLPKKITLQEYQDWKAQEEALAATFRDRDEHGEMLDYEDFSSQDDLANIDIGFWTLTPAPEAPDPMASSRPTIVPVITMNPPSHHPMVAANRTPGYDRGMALSNALPIHIGMPVTSPRMTLAHGITTEEILL